MSETTYNRTYAPRGVDNGPFEATCVGSDSDGYRVTVTPKDGDTEAVGTFPALTPAWKAMVAHVKGIPLDKVGSFSGPREWTGASRSSNGQTRSGGSSAVNLYAMCAHLADLAGVDFSDAATTDALCFDGTLDSDDGDAFKAAIVDAQARRKAKGDVGKQLKSLRAERKQLIKMRDKRAAAGRSTDRVDLMIDDLQDEIDELSDSVEDNG